MDDHSLGQRIRRLREQRRLTQVELAEALTVSAKTVSNWESGRNNPRASIGAINKFFSTDLEAAEITAMDPVEVALRQSSLHEWRQDAVLSFYKRQIHEQRGEATAETEFEEATRIGTEMRLAANRGESQGRARRKQQDDDAAAGGA